MKNKNSVNMEDILLSELDISHSPDRNKQKKQINVHPLHMYKDFFKDVYKNIISKILWIICIKR